MNIVSSDAEMDIIECIANITKELYIIPKEMLLPHFLECVSQLINKQKKKNHRKMH